MVPTTILSSTSILSAPLPTIYDSPSPAQPNATSIPYDNDEIAYPKVNAFTSELQDLYLSYNPFDPTTTDTIKVGGVHPTLGLELEANDTND